eukprot:TRINITY_DN51676_c0_g2_i1.p1 TRINITY_DN51676_c0_g2~~TRINITY_DN51676_c0_g2_i1.p1  ORF type:complete len:226 (-),score=82.66 TRINITY_DN51676_c0_g2_i1:119-796(-)
MAPAAAADEAGGAGAAAAAAAEVSAEVVDAAEEALLDAVEHGSVQEIRDALRRAEEVGVDAEMITLARDTLNSRVEHATLSAQAAARPAGATATPDGATPTTASTTPDEEDPDRAVQQALLRLEEASAGTSVEELQAAIRRAEALGVDGETLDASREALETVRLLAEAKEDSENGLRQAMKLDYVEMLEAAIDLAEEAGADEALVEEARARRTALVSAGASASAS